VVNRAGASLSNKPYQGSFFTGFIEIALPGDCIEPNSREAGLYEGFAEKTERLGS